MVDIICAIAVHGVPPDVSSEEMMQHFGTSGDITHLLLVRESHSTQCTGRGYVMYKTSDSAADAIDKLAGSSITGKETHKFSIEAATSSQFAEITTLLGKHRLDSLNLPPWTGSPVGVDFVHQLVHKLSSLSDLEVNQLFAEMKNSRGDAISFPTTKTS